MSLLVLIYLIIVISNYTIIYYIAKDEILGETTIYHLRKYINESRKNAFDKALVPILNIIVLLKLLWELLWEYIGGIKLFTQNKR